MRQIRSPFAVALGLALVLLGIGVSRSVVSAQAKTTWSGIFTAEQVARGKSEAMTECSQCHGATLKGDFAPPLIGTDFIDHWYGIPLGDLTMLIQNTMPQTAPGSLKAEEYAEIVAYLLSENGFPAGTETLTLTPEAVSAIKITKTK